MYVFIGMQAMDASLENAAMLLNKVPACAMCGSGRYRDQVHAYLSKPQQDAVAAGHAKHYPAQPRCNLSFLLDASAGSVAE